MTLNAPVIVALKITRAMALQETRKRFAERLWVFYNRPPSELSDDDVAAWLARSETGRRFLEKFK